MADLKAAAELQEKKLALAREEVLKLRDQVRFEQNLRLRPLRARSPKWNPFAEPALVKRILGFKDWSKSELSDLSRLSKAWRLEVQRILFAKFVEIVLIDKEMFVQSMPFLGLDAEVRYV